MSANARVTSSRPVPSARCRLCAPWPGGSVRLVRRPPIVLVCSLPLWLLACSADQAQPANPPAPTEPTASTPSTASFETVANAQLDAYIEAHPGRGVELGLHQYDGKLPEVSQAALDAEIARLEASIADLDAVDPAGLSKLEKVERDTLLTTLRGTHFDLATRRHPWRNPMFYLEPLSLSAYISRDYAPLEERAAAIIAIASATPGHLEHAKTNLEPNLPRTFIETALLQTRGNATFVREDVTKAVQELAQTNPELHTKVTASLADMAKALDAFAVFLEERKGQATDEYALGAETFAAMLKQTQGFDVDLARLQEVLQADLQRNLAAMDAAAKTIDPKKSTKKVVAQVSKKKPAAKAVLQVATDQAQEMRQFLIDERIVTIPTDDTAKVVESPPFMRWNAAFLDSAGVFEQKALPSFYYISPPDPKWPKAKQRDYIPGTSDLLFITIHEVWPGHFLHGLHVKTNDSRILKSLWNYASGEGWAHYTEEMMWNQGISEDPAVHIGQLQNALLRNVRALSAIGLHTGTMSVEQSKQMFLDQGFQDEANAEQQATRGTFDPMYLAYTIGKLAILKLRDDYKKKMEAEGKPFDLQAFHDEFLSYGAAPLPAVREAMLGPDAGPVL